MSVGKITRQVRRHSTRNAIKAAIKSNTDILKEVWTKAYTLGWVNALSMVEHSTDKLKYEVKVNVPDALDAINFTTPVTPDTGVQL